MAIPKSSAFFPNDQYAFSDSDSEPELEPVNEAAEAMLKRCTKLLEEVEAFLTLLRKSQLQNKVEVRGFLNQVKAEHRIIQGLCLEPADSTKSKKGIDGLNLPYLEAVWDTAKRTTGLVGLNKSYSIRLDRPVGPDGTLGKRPKDKVTVDVVAGNGLQWLKISLLTPRRLLFELAKAGWEDAGFSSDEDTSPTSAPLATSTLSLTTLARTLLHAASQTRIQYLHPTVHLILPHLSPTDPEPIPTFLKELVELGVRIECGSLEHPTVLTPPQSLDELLTHLTSPLSSRTRPLTDPLNLDTTILIALISDISHTPAVSADPRFHPAILSQLEHEQKSAFLPEHLYPVVRGRELVCTSAARSRFEEIVGMMASPAERRRAGLILSAVAEGETVERRAERWREGSCHALPEGGLRLPVRTLAEEEEYEPREEDEEVVKVVSGRLSGTNRAVFVTAWLRGWTNVTTNRAVERHIVTALEGWEWKEGDGVLREGPDMCVVSAVRSLLGPGRGLEEEEVKKTWAGRGTG